MNKLPIRNTIGITPNLVFRDPCFLDFLGLEDTYSEKDLEPAIVLNINL